MQHQCLIISRSAAWHPALELVSALRGDGFQPISSPNALSETLSPGDFLLIPLHAGKQGLDCISRCRQDGIYNPIIALGRNHVHPDCVDALNLGADDYVSTGVDPREFMARVRAVLRRSAAPVGASTVIGPVTLDPSRHAASVADQTISLTSYEFAILLRLVRARGRILARNQLVDAAPERNRQAQSNSTEVTIHNLRKKVGTSTILTIRGIGYQINTASQHAETDWKGSHQQRP